MVVVESTGTGTAAGASVAGMTEPQPPLSDRSPSPTRPGPPDPPLPPPWRTIGTTWRRFAPRSSPPPSAPARRRRDPSAARVQDCPRGAAAHRPRRWHHPYGENKVQEAKRKAENLAGLGIHWAVIGHLQTNKAKDVAAFADEFQALDSLRVAEALDRRLQAAGRGPGRLRAGQLRRARPPSSDSSPARCRPS